MEPTARVADAVARRVRAGGTNLAFGHPGGEVVTLIDAFRQAGIRFVLTHHEASAAFGAGGYAEVTGRPGACIATLGPGATNLVTGIASALLERAPMLAFTGSLPESAPAGATHQRLPLQDLFESVAKASVHLTDDDPAAAVGRAISTATAPRPGPVHLSLAADVAAREQGPAAVEPSQTQPRPTHQDPTAVARAKDLLARARRPAIVVGLTAARVCGEQPIRRLATTLRAPVVVTPKAKGVVLETDPLFLGVIDMAGDPLIGEFLNGADLILAIGCDVVELDRRWTWTAPVIHIDEQPNTDGYYDSAEELVGSIDQALGTLAESARRGSWSLEEIALCRAEVLDYIKPQLEHLQPWHVVESVQRHAGPDVVATCDVGAHKMLVGQCWETHAPRRFFMANGLSSMGYSIPTALAAHLVEPTRRVVAFVGDGGLSMYLGELETLVRTKANLTVVVFADRSLELIRRAEQRRGVSTDSVSFENPDFLAIGRAFGIQASEATTVHELERALTASDRDAGVHLVAARIDGSDYRL